MYDWVPHFWQGIGYLIAMFLGWVVGRHCRLQPEVHPDMVLEKVREVTEVTEGVRRLRQQRDLWKRKFKAERARANLLEYQLDPKIRHGSPAEFIQLECED